MSIEEKLQWMETLWEDLSQHADEVPPPAWHGKPLAEREAAPEPAPRGIQIGGATGTTWEPPLPRAYYPPGREQRVAAVAPVTQRVRRLAA